MATTEQRESCHQDPGGCQRELGFHSTILCNQVLSYLVKIFGFNTSEQFWDICMAKCVPYHLSENIKHAKLGKHKVAFCNTTDSGVME